MDALDPILPELHEIAAHLQSEISAQDRSYRLKTYKNSFHGGDAVSWLIKNNYAQATDQALALGNLLLYVGYIRSGFKDYAFHSNGLYSFTAREAMDQRRAIQLAQRDKVRVLELELRATKQILQSVQQNQKVERQVGLALVVFFLVFFVSPNIYISAFVLVLCATIAWHLDFNTGRIRRKSLAVVGLAGENDSLKAGENDASDLLPSLASSSPNPIRGHRRSQSGETLRRPPHDDEAGSSGLPKSTSSCLLGINTSSGPRTRTPSPCPKTPRGVSSIPIPSCSSSRPSTPRVVSTPRPLSKDTSLDSSHSSSSSSSYTTTTSSTSSSTSSSSLHFFDSLSDLISYYDIEFNASEEVYCACVVADISLPNQPIVFANNAFCELSKYSREDLLGKNCRMLQGPGTNKKDIQAVRDLVNSRSEGFVKLLNYTKQGRPFINMLYLVPLRNRKGGIQFYLGCQTPISELEEAQVCPPPAPVPAQPLAPLPEGQVSKVKIHVKTEPQCVGTANSKPLPFESEYFKGFFSMKAKTKVNPDPFFNGLNRMFEVQMQGVFKQSFPATTQIWFGGEISKPMVLGRFKRTMAGLLLKFVSSFGRGLHYSFGDNESHGDHPHMVFPLLAAIDRCIITPPDGTPPVLGDPIPDTPENKAFRRNTPSTGATFQVGPIYTLCFYSMYIDFETWESCNLKGFSNMNLHTFWEDQKLTFVMYALDEKEVHHSIANRKIICHFELSHEDDDQYLSESKT